ncbi:MAG: AMP-binding protein, partial [bacterium]|nr:AMP-binding protein [bacterium]
MGVVKFSFSQSLFSTALKITRGADVRVHMVLVTGLFVLLNKYTRGNDIMIGSPIAKQEFEGEFINTILVFRNDVAGNVTFKELLMQVRETIVKANEHQNYPMEILMEELSLPMEEGEFPLFDTVVLLENLHDKRYLGDIHYNMLFSFLKTGESIEGVVDYNTSLYRESTVKQVISFYMYIMEQMLSDPDLPLSQVEILSGDDRKQVLLDFNSTEDAYPQDKTLHRLFEEQVERMPDRIAMAGEEQLTYRELNSKSDGLAYLLMEKGVEPGAIVAVIVEPSTGMFVALLGILKAGGAYLPIDPACPKERIDYMLADSNAKIVLDPTHPALWAPLSRGDLKNACADSHGKSPLERGTPKGGGVSNFAHSPESLAYIIYTSGTTGKPKGVMVEHRNVVAYLYAFFKEFDIRPTDTVVQLASYTFDVFVEEVFPILLRGGKVIIPGASEKMDMELLCRLLLKHHVNIIDCTPLLLNEFNKLDLQKPGNTSAGYIFISGGDVLKSEYVDKLVKVGKVYNTYGPTESTVCATHYNYGESCKEGGFDDFSTIP